MEPTSPILSLFASLAAAAEPIHLLNVYKGVPIAYPAVITEVAADRLRVRTERFQVVCLYQDRQTFIQHPILPTLLRANVSAIDIPAQAVTLSGFHVPRGRLGDRTHVRVQPARLLESEIAAPGSPQAYIAELADISQDGLAIYLPERVFSPTIFAKGDPIAISLRLPGTYPAPSVRPAPEPRPTSNPLDRFDRDAIRHPHLPDHPRPNTSPSAYQSTEFPPISLHGVVANLRLEIDRARYRVGIRLNAQDAARFYLSQFISQRQAQIVREIRELYDLLANQPPTP
jgi:hypothetical protein